MLSEDNMLLCMFQRLRTYFQDAGVLIFGGYVLSGHCSRQQLSVKKIEGYLFSEGYLFTGVYGTATLNFVCDHISDVVPCWTESLVAENLSYIWEMLIMREQWWSVLVLVSNILRNAIFFLSYAFLQDVWVSRWQGSSMVCSMQLFMSFFFFCLLSTQVFFSIWYCVSVGLTFYLV